MTAYIIRRVLALVPVLFVVSLITFLLMHVAPGGPFEGQEGKRQDPYMQKRMEEAFGLHKPLYEQYYIYMSNAVRLDFGPSFQQRGRNVTDILKEHFGYSIKLGLLALAFAICVGLPLGIIAALRQNSWVDYLSLLIATVGIAVPSFVLSLYLLLFFSTTLGWFDVLPTYDLELKPWILPTIALGLPSAALLARLARSSMVEVIRQDYVRTARAKGLRENVIVLRHIIKNAMIPVWTVLGPLTAGLITGSFVVERIFRIPGIGSFFIDAIGNRDYSMIMATTLIYSFMIVVFNLLTDITYGLFDPRVKVSS
jgi:oligopeptide transport system permease protein